MANTICKEQSGTGFVPPSLIVKIIANPNALSLSIVDDSNKDSNVYKGVEVLPGIESSAGTFGVSYDANKLCHFIDSTNKID